MEIISWKMRAYDFYSRVQLEKETNELAQRTSRVFDTYQGMNNSHSERF